MFNNTGFMVEKAVNTNQILIDPSKYFAMGCVVDDPAAVAVNGKKIMKAGTLLTGDLNDRITAFTPAATDSGVSDVVGVLLHDTDITSGANNAAVVIWGFINTSRMDDDVKAKITDEVIGAMYGKIWFIEC